MSSLLAALPLAGTLINVAAVATGTAVGVAVGHRLSERIRVTVMDALGLVTLALGVDGALAAFREPLSSFSRGSVLIVMGSVLVGGLLGELARLEDRLEAFGETSKLRFGDGQAHFVEGFVVASLIFCVGPMAVLGSIQDGLSGDYELLAIKSMLDAFAALTAAGGLLIIGISLRLLDLKSVRVGNMLPALAIAPAVVWLMQTLG